MNINNKLVISFVILVMGLSSLITIASAQEASSEETIAVLPICDHNNDGSRNLSDVAMFAECAETFDGNGDGVHDLSDISLYTSNNQDNTWCAAFVCGNEALSSVELVEEPVAVLPICDHNGDHVRNLTDVAMFAECAETFDGNGDGIHDLADISLYTSNNQDDIWCTTDFDCVATSTEAFYSSEVAEETTDILDICDHNGDGLRNLSDISEFASCKDTFDANGDGTHDLEDISEYAVNKLRNDGWCTTTFECVATPEPISSTPQILGGSTFFDEATKSEIETEVLGEKIEGEKDVLEIEVCTYNTPDADVLGKTEWIDGSLMRGCGPEVYIIENQQKRHIRSLEELFNYIGQRINNVTNDILNLF